MVTRTGTCRRQICFQNRVDILYISFHDEHVNILPMFIRYLKRIFKEFLIVRTVIIFIVLRSYSIILTTIKLNDNKTNLALTIIRFNRLIVSSICKNLNNIKFQK